MTKTFRERFFSKSVVVLSFYVHVFDALYVDVVYQKKLGGIEFVREVLDAAVALLPLFPFFSIGIAFIFLEVGELFEHYHIPTESLNQPIYYGVLYGPFAYVYVRVKRVAKVSTILPRSV